MKRLISITVLSCIASVATAQIADLRYRDREWKCAHCDRTKSTRTLVEIVNLISGDRSRLENQLLWSGEYVNLEPGASAKPEYCNNLNWNYCEYRMLSEKRFIARKNFNGVDYGQQVEDNLIRAVRSTMESGPANIRVVYDKFDDREAKEDFERYMEQMGKSKNTQSREIEQTEPSYDNPNYYNRR